MSSSLKVIQAEVTRRRMENTPSRERNIQTIARWICTTAGNDPDALVFLGPAQLLNAKHQYLMVPTARTIPAWRAYQVEAEAALDAIPLLRFDD